MSDKIVLLGKNNEGKSNLLKALNIAMTVLEYCSERGESNAYRRRQYRGNDETFYSWERDFPIIKRNGKEDKNYNSIFRLTFRLTQGEIEEFQKQIHSKINGLLPIEIEMGNEGISSCKVAKKGSGGKTLSEKFSQIAKFICDKISINYIPAIRTNNESMTIIRRMLGNELTELENNEDYKRALETISSLQRPILAKLEKDIQESLKIFLPSVNFVKLDFSEERRRFLLRSDIKVFINDGTTTDIDYKGDGVKSLVALSLLNQSLKIGKTIVIIEEPESHLHPEAIHNLSIRINDLAKGNQVILSTHNPLFVDRKNVKKNVLVQNGKATPASDISVIREVLGVKISDNLYNANFVLLVEGESDQKALTALLPVLSTKLAKAFNDKMLVIRKIRGTGNLSYELNSMKSLLCAIHVFLDNDKAGHEAFKLAQNENLIHLKDVTFSICKGMRESEFEDCIKEEVYHDKLYEKYGVRLSSFRSSKKWSERVKDAFSKCGKPWDDKIENGVKELVADSVVNHSSDVLNEHKRYSIDALVKQLEELIK